MSGRVVVITGASAGIGRAMARRFAAHGDDVALVARGEAGLDAAAEEARALGVRALVVPTDVADFAAVQRAADEVEDQLGPIDVWVNDAFSSVFAPFWEIDPDEYRRATDVTYLGFVWGTRVALDHMMPRDRGTIVEVGSALAHRGIPLQSVYCGAKHAIQGFVESLRTELMHEGSGVQLAIVHMPGLNTPQFSWVLSRLPRHPRPVAPVYQPEIAADAVLYASLHPERRQYWVGASTVGTIVGNRLASGLMDRYLARTGFSGQQTPDPTSPDRPANLWEPVDDDHDVGAHGEFDDSAHAHSPQWWLSKHRWSAAGIGAGVALVGAMGLVRGQR
jgi:NAD(P)-dependent dehydrogenase (short-subunit alcohol dehydrogenase family)